MTKPDYCKDCVLYAAPGPTLAQGNPDTAKLIYIIDQPSSRDAHAGSILSDGTGNILNRQLYDAGLYRSELFITSMVKCECPKDMFWQAALKCSKFITNEINKCKSDTVILAGQLPFTKYIGQYSTLLPNYRPPDNVNTRMGCVEQRHGKKWIGLPHPSEYMRQTDARDEVVMHLKKAKSISGKQVLKPEVYTKSCDKTLTDVMHTIQQDIGYFSDDVETYIPTGIAEDDYVGGDYKVDMAAISFGPSIAYCLQPEQLKVFIPLYRDPSVTNYQHNGMYDQFHVSRIIGHENMYRDQYLTNRYNPWMDGMLAAHYHKSFKYKYLKPDCLSRYTTLPYYDRSIEKVDREFYNGLDVITTHQECVTLTSLLQQMHCWELFNEIGMSILPILEEQRVVGVNVDVKKALLFKHILQIKVDESLRLLRELGGGLDPTNHNDLKKILYNTYQLPVQKSKDKSGITTNAAARERLLLWIDDPKHPERKELYSIPRQIMTLMDYYSGEKKKIEYIDRISPDFRIHAYYKAHGTWTFRPSSTPNLQNFPVHEITEWKGDKRTNPLGLEEKDKLGSLRSLVIPDHEDDLILSIDLNQVQVWIYAELADVKWLKEIRNKGEYLYGVVYEALYKKPFFTEGLPRTKRNKRKDVHAADLRNAKTVPLGFLFGRQGEAVAIQYQWPISEGVALRKWFFDQVPELQTKHTEIIYQGKQQGWLRFPYGNTCWFPDLKTTDMLNAPAQSTEAFMLQESMVMIKREFERRKYEKTRLMLSVHDSISINVAGAVKDPTIMLDVYETIVKPILDRPNKYLNNAVFPHEAEVSAAWDYETTDFDTWKDEINARSISGSGKN